MSLEPYTNPVARLLTFGSTGSYKPKEWPNYIEEAGLTATDVPELIRMATDPRFDEVASDEDEDEDEEVEKDAVWAPVHAMRALGQLRAEAAIAPLLTLFPLDDDFFRENLPGVFGLIGPAAIAPLANFLDDSTQDRWARVLANDCLEQVALHFPETRPDCVTILTDQLVKYREREDEILDSSLIDTLVHLQAKEAAPLIGEVFAAKDVDEFLTGSWPMVQVQLGLKQESDFTPEELEPEPPESVIRLRRFLQAQVVQERHKNKPSGFAPAPSAKSSKKSSKKKKK
ncbi:MAG: DUF1186 domain-containing protein [Synechococcales bacterium]|nr:DUF1186 domain-containing protein [Synechococcales bacterium]